MSDIGGIAGDHLRSFVERIERLHTERTALGQDLKEVYSEAKGTGFDTKIIKLIVRERARDADDMAEEADLLDLYRRALGMKRREPRKAAA